MFRQLGDGEARFSNNRSSVKFDSLLVTAAGGFHLISFMFSLPSSIVALLRASEVHLLSEYNFHN